MSFIMNADTLIGGFISLSSVIKSGSREVKKIIFDKERKNKICSSSYHFPEKKQYAFLEKYISETETEMTYMDAASFASLTRGESYGGIAAYVGERKIKSVAKLLESDGGNGFYLILEGIEDPFNFGYTLRTAYACGCGGVILPERNYFTSSDIVIRSSAGASELIDIAYYKSVDEAAEALKAHGVRIVCTSKEKGSVNLDEAELKAPLCVVIGGERRGISSTLTSRADLMIAVEYKRSYAMSLSASSAASIIIYETAKKIFI